MAEPAAEIRDHYHDHVRRDVIPHVPRAGGSLLDLGGGLGATAARLKELGVADRIGVVDMIAPEAEALPIDFRYSGNLEDMALIDRVIVEQGPFDTILALDILEHLVDPWAIVARLHRGLKPGGRIVASIPNIRNYRALLPLLLRNQWQLADAGILDRTHLRFFVRQSAIELITSSGLELEAVAPSQSGGRKIALFRKLTLGLLNSFTDRQYIVTVRRVD